MVRLQKAELGVLDWIRAMFRRKSGYNFIPRLSTLDWYTEFPEKDFFTNYFDLSDPEKFLASA